MQMRIGSKVLGALLCATAVAVVVVATASVQAQNKSDSEVKVTASMAKPDTISIKLSVNKGWHIYANPVGNQTLASAATVVNVTGAKAEDVQVSYPPGKVKKDEAGSYRIYEGEVDIQATLKKAPGAGPVEVSVRFMACNDKTCLLPATVKLKAK